MIKIIHYIIGLSEAGSLVTHLNSANLQKRLPELEEAVKAEEKAATEEDKEPGGSV